ncbi:hypothetical protein CHS0354_016966, partial [Potamilus streckersoni]
EKIREETKNCDYIHWTLFIAFCIFSLDHRNLRRRRIGMMRRSKHCSGVLVLLLVVCCKVKNQMTKSRVFYSNVPRTKVNDASVDDNDFANTIRLIRDNYVTTGYNTTPSVVEKNDVSQRLDSGKDHTAFKVTINGSNENNQTSVLICDFSGVSARITFSSWIHVWKGWIIRDGLQGKMHDLINELIIDKLTLEDMGTYICYGASSFNGTRGKNTHIGYENIKVTGVPNILRENTIFLGEIGRPVNITIPFYSDPAVESFFIQTNSAVIPNTSCINLYIVPEPIDYLMYGKTIQIDAQMLHYDILNASESDFCNYTLVLTNPIGLKEFTFQLALFDASANNGKINGSNENNQRTVLSCDFSGVSARITFSSWIHVWEGRVIRDGLQGRIHDNINELIIDKLSLGDMGTYICFGSISINGTREKKTHIRYKNIKITGVPNILREISTYLGEIGHPVNIAIPFYSDPAVESFLIRKNGTVLPNTSCINSYIVPEPIDYLMYDKSMKIEAQMLHFIILNASESDFCNYTLILKNPMGQKEFRFQLVLFVENTGNLAPFMRLFFAVCAALVIAYTALIVIVLRIKRRRHFHGIYMKKGKESIHNSEDSREEGTVNTNSVYDCHITSEHGHTLDGLVSTAAGNLYSEICDGRDDHNVSQHIRSSERDAYDKIHTYSNSQDPTYSKLNIIKRLKDARVSFRRKN